MEVFAKSDLGKARDINEDAVYIPEEDLGINVYILADGMGGYQGGDVASQLAVTAARSYILNNYEITFEEKEDILKLVNGSIEYANMVVAEKAKTDKKLNKMGSTLEVLLIIKNEAYIGHVGDSRIYMIRNRTIKQLTKDHSYIEKLIKDGRITKEESSKHPDKNMITKAIGTEIVVEAELIHKKLQKDDILILCSDGLTNLVTDKEILELVVDSFDEDIAEKLINKANELGGTDNVSVIVLRYR